MLLIIIGFISNYLNRLARFSDFIAAFGLALVCIHGSFIDLSLLLTLCSYFQFLSIDISFCWACIMNFSVQYA